MPQMSPTNWIILFLLTNSIMSLMLSIIYFSPVFYQSKKYIHNLSEYPQWPW